MQATTTAAILVGKGLPRANASAFVDAAVPCGNRIGGQSYATVSWRGISHATYADGPDASGVDAGGVDAAAAHEQGLHVRARGEVQTGS